MTQITTTLGRMARRIPMLAIPLFVAATGTAAAHGGGSYGGGMMGGGGWGLFGGLMGLLWMGILVAVLLLLGYSLFERRTDESNDRPQSVLRERYARGELSDDEFERRREQLE
ncbi:SHOCT domain-containing protein [Halopenitus sp. H-Gu1]|uniref:SHOCT domain-containing protein n=1 Tax=Halopenitus sp. H-Gu1 TaxID=3242697 RepID=UPI00359D405E